MSGLATSKLRSTDLIGLAGSREAWTTRATNRKGLADLVRGAYTHLIRGPFHPVWNYALRPQ